MSCNVPRRRSLIVFVLMLTALLVTPGVAFANHSTTPGWYWLHPLPTGYNRYSDVSMVGDDVWVTTGRPMVLHSADAGRTWAPLPLIGAVVTYDRIEFVSSTTGWAWSRESQCLYRSVDGGISWGISLPLSAADEVADICALDEQHAWVLCRDEAAGEWTVYRTDNGVSWQAGALLPARFDDLDFADALNGFAVATSVSEDPQGTVTSTAELFRTTDGGQSWNVAAVEADAQLFAVQAHGGDRVWVGGARVDPFSDNPVPVPFIACSDDAGGTWREVTPPVVSGYVVSLTSADGELGWAAICSPAAGSWAPLLETTDGGASWRAVYGEEVGDVACSAEGAVVAAGTKAVNRGKLAWSSRKRLVQRSPGLAFVERDPSTLPPYGPLYRMTFADATRGWALNGGRRVVRTTNAGATWATSEVPSTEKDVALNALCAVTPETLLAGGKVGDFMNSYSRGAMFRSDDGGISWVEIDPGTEDEVTHITFADAAHGWAFTWTDLLRTTDGGASWNSVIAPAGYDWQGAASPSADSVLLTARNTVSERHCVVRWTASTGWEQIFTAPEGVYLWGISMVDAQRGWLWGNAGALYRTSDGGATWQRVNLGYLLSAEQLSKLEIVQVAFGDAQRGWALGVSSVSSPYSTVVLSTADGGAMWEIEEVGEDFVNGPVRELAAAGDRVWVGGSDWTHCELIANFDPDPDPPVTSVTTAYDGRWTNQPVSLTLDAADSGVGVAYTRFGLPGLPWAYGGTVDVPAPSDYSNDGAWTVRYQSVDEVANAETPRRHVVKIDTTPPGNPNVAVDPQPVNGYRGPNLTVRWSSQDWGELRSVRAEAAVTCVDVVGDRAYVIDGTLLRVLDLFNPEDPVELGRLDLGAGLALADLAVVGDYAYVVLQTLGLVVVDVSDPEHPAWAAATVIRGEPTRIAITNRCAFVTTNEGVAVVDLEKPALPHQDGLIELRAVSDVAADGDLLAVTAGDSLVTYDVSNPADAREIGAYGFKIWPFAVAVHRDVACVTWGAWASVLSTPLQNAPSLLSEVTAAGPFADVVLADETLTLLAPSTGVARVDLGALDEPLNIGWTFLPAGNHTAIDATPAYVFVADGTAGLTVAREMQTEAASYAIDPSSTTDPDGNPEVVGSREAAVSGLQDGAHYVHVRTRDQAGNWSGTTHLSVDIDAGGPTIATNADSAWHRSFTFTASAADAKSGLASLELAVDGGPWQAVSSLTLRTWKRGGGSGQHTVICRATDRVGNAVARPASVYLDGRAPVTTDDAPRNPLDPWNPPPQPGAVTVTLTPTDAHSGVAKTWYSLDGGGWTEGTSVAVPAAEGRHWIGYYSEDFVGNVEYSHWVPVVVDLPSGASTKSVLRGPRR